MGTMPLEWCRVAVHRLVLEWYDCC